MIETSLFCPKTGHASPPVADTLFNFSSSIDSKRVAILSTSCSPTSSHSWPDISSMSFVCCRRLVTSLSKLNHRSSSSHCYQILSSHMCIYHIYIYNISYISYIWIMIIQKKTIPFKRTWKKASATIASLLHRPSKTFC